MAFKPRKEAVVSTDRSSGAATAVEAEAAAWIARADRGLTAAEDAALAQWRDADVRHRIAWLRLNAAWSQADRLAALKVEPQAARPDKNRRSTLWRDRMGRLARQARRAGPMPQAVTAVAACLVLFAGGHFAQLQIWGHPLSTPVGGRMVAPLDDGSRIEINTDSRIRVSVNGLRRKVWIDQGEAYFDVAPDPGRPFVIQAGERQVTVVGTQFSVQREGHGVLVRVAEGQVDVQGRFDGRTVRAGAGDEVRVEGRRLTRVRRGLDAIQGELGWRSGRLIFQDATLGEVAAEFNRYNTRKLRLADDEVGAIRVGGAFAASNVAGFAGLMTESFGLRAEHRDGEIIISR
jgi:transmembrane sensor